MPLTPRVIGIGALRRDPASPRQRRRALAPSRRPVAGEGRAYPPTMALRPGDAAPEFALSDQRGNRTALSSFRGRKVLVFFYPKDVDYLPYLTQAGTRGDASEGATRTPLPPGCLSTTPRSISAVRLTTWTRSASCTTTAPSASPGHLPGELVGYASTLVRRLTVLVNQDTRLDSRDRVEKQPRELGDISPWTSRSRGVLG